MDVVSSYVGLNPIGEVRRWDKKAKQFIIVKRPNIFETYNKLMGGVDLLDSLVSLYKQKMKSRRWYMYIFWHTILIAAVNAWLWYKPHCSLLHRKPMKLCNFIRDVASGLIEFKSKVGRPAGLSPQPSLPKPLTRKPTRDVSQDCLDHFPLWDANRQRCKYQYCEGFSYVKCN